MELLNHLTLGFSEALSLGKVGYVFLGTLLGALVGALPGLGPLTGVALALPFVQTMGTADGLIMLLCIYLGARNAESTMSMLLMGTEPPGILGAKSGGPHAVPGGLPQADWSAIRLGSFASGLIGVFLLSLFVGPLAEFVSRLSAADYLSLTVFGLVGAIVLSSGSILKALGMAVLGLLLSQVGLDIFSGVPRYTLGITELREDGLNVVAMAIGICGLSRILFVLGQMPDVGEQGPRNTSWLWPAALNQRLRSAWLFRGAAWGALLGMLPGSGGRLASHIAQKSRSSAASNTGDQDRDDAQFVKAASRECANSAAEKTAFISVLVIGMVPSGISALLIVALAIKGASPGPDFINRDPAFFWGFIASMVLSSVFLLALTHPLVALWVRLRRVPRHYVFPALTVFGCIGVYSLNQHAFDVLLSATLAGVGYIFYKLGCELVPLLVGFVSGPILEQHLRQALIYSNGDWGVFVSRPISGGALAASALLITVALFPSINRLREQVFKKFPSP